MARSGDKKISVKIVHSNVPAIEALVAQICENLPEIELIVVDANEPDSDTGISCGYQLSENELQQLVESREEFLRMKHLQVIERKPRGMRAFLRSLELSSAVSVVRQAWQEKRRKPWRKRR